MKTLEQKIEVMQSALAGKKIEIMNLTRDNKWEPLFRPELSPFSWGGFDYRIKPEPMEFWVNVRDSGVLDVCSSEDSALKIADSKVIKTIKVREVAND